MKIEIIVFLTLLIGFSIFAQDATTDNKNSSSSSSISENQSSSSSSVITNINNQKKNGYDLWNEGKYNESIASLMEEKKYFPDRVNIYIILGWDYKELKNYSEMEKVSLEGIKYDPNHISVIRNLAEAYFYQNKFTDAVPYFQKYISKRNIKTDNYILTAYYLLGISLYNIGYYNKADIAFSTVKHLQPGNINAFIYLAQTKEKLQDYNKALILFNEVLKLSPNNTQALDGIQRINNIKK